MKTNYEIIKEVHQIVDELCKDDLPRAKTVMAIWRAFRLGREYDDLNAASSTSDVDTDQGDEATFDVQADEQTAELGRATCDECGQANISGKVCPNCGARRI